MIDAILHQTADAEAYLPMLSATLPANREFCRRHGIRLEAFIGIRRGCHPWHAAFNRLAFLRDRLAEGFRGWAIYLDADAFVAEMDFDIGAYLAARAGSALVVPPGAGRGDWDVNSGVMLWNFAQAPARLMAERWIALFDAIPDAALRQAAAWDEVENDQRLLHRVLQADPALTATIHRESDQLIGYQHSRFIKQFVRNEVHTQEQRVLRIARQVAISLRRAGVAPVVDAAQVMAAHELLTGAPPPTLEAAFAALEAPDLPALAARLRGA
ncbi:hypothetical protein [Falsiroseomonas ponticola]|uniref:hypothetical protein n=1 Tax=Falsiroseomonas ponticola TaxID=2786951 RepID=UPI0019333519|nr:hypothetical protein [Roseomonas ponticola]